MSEGEARTSHAHRLAEAAARLKHTTRALHVLGWGEARLTLGHGATGGSDTVELDAEAREALRPVLEAQRERALAEVRRLAGEG